jgi:hypothetical protein
MRSTVGPVCGVSYPSLSITSLQSLPEVLAGPEAQGKRPRQSHITTDGQSVIISRYRAHSGTCDQILLSVRRLKNSHFTLYNHGTDPLRNHRLLSRVFTTAHLNNHINNQRLVTDFSIVEVLRSVTG